jgi:sporulation protein YlmC with PRC-barrel domain
MRIKEDLINKEVLDGGANLIGKVIDVVMDKDTFEVTDLVLKKSGLTDQFKAGGENVVPTELIRVIGDKILLKNDDDI